MFMMVHSETPYFMVRTPLCHTLPDCTQHPLVPCRVPCLSFIDAGPQMLSLGSTPSVAFCYSHAATDTALATLDPFTKPRLSKELWASCTGVRQRQGAREAGGTRRDSGGRRFDAGGAAPVALAAAAGARPERRLRCRPDLGCAQAYMSLLC
jgi:hypothetical protein